MSTSPAKPSARAARKYGANCRDTARNPRRAVTNFKQSRDIHEDRSTLQSKSGRNYQPPRRS